MRKVLVGLVLAVAMAACGADESSTPEASTPETSATTEFVPDTLPERLLTEFASDELGLRVKFPVDWLPEEDAASGFVGFTAPPIVGDTFVENFNIVVVDLPAGMTLSQYVQQDGIRLAGSIADYAVIGGYEATMTGQTASAVAFTGTVDGVAISVLRLLAIADGRGVEFTFLASEGEFENFGPVVDQLIASVEVDGR